MDKNAIKKYAVWARRELIERVSQRALVYGITAKDAGDPNAESVNGHLLSQAEKRQRQALIRNVKAKGYEQVCEEVAYTWFNRFAALRFMEVNGYLPSHIRVFTNDAGEFKPQILTEAIHLELDGLDMNKVYALEEANKTEELFKYPDYLLREGSVIEQMVTTIPEEDWADQVQIIGWLYQYYNTEPKDKVFADLKKNIKITKENIPAATQLFTPDWIVHYMVENSLGRLWLEGHPNDALKAELKYYLDEAQQEPEVQAQLAEIRKEYAALKPEEIRVIDPCMGSGHILCVLFDVLVRIYEDYGYTAREAAVKIVENNLWGLDVDDRAAQLAYFTVMMKARLYDRRFFTRKVQPHVYAIQETNSLREDYKRARDDFRLSKEHQDTLDYLVNAFIDAKVYGSILQLEHRDYVSLKSAWNLRDLKQAENTNITLWTTIVAPKISLLLDQAIAITQSYHSVVVNPPYLNFRSMNARLLDYCNKFFPMSKADLFGVFIERSAQLCNSMGMLALITMQNWMYIDSFNDFRERFIPTIGLKNVIHLGMRAFDSGDVGTIVKTVAFVAQKKNNNSEIIFIDLRGEETSELKERRFIEIASGKLFGTKEVYANKQSNFLLVPNAPITYAFNDNIFRLFDEKRFLEGILPGRS